MNLNDSKKRHWTKLTVGVVFLLLMVLLVFTLSSRPSGQTDCVSCHIKVDSLQEPFDLRGYWMFTRHDDPRNALPGIQGSDWILARVPGSWNGLYPDDQNYRIGWYRGHLNFDPKLVGQEVIFLLDAYMSDLDVYLDGQRIFYRHGGQSVRNFYPIQPVPVRFKITQTEHVLAFRVDSIMMMGIYQLPFELRQDREYDLGLALNHFLMGDVRVIIACSVFAFGLFFLLMYFLTRSVFYLAGALALMTPLPYFVFPSESLLRFFSSENALLLHYLGIGSMAYAHSFFCQFFGRFYRRFNTITFVVLMIFNLGFIASCFHLNLDLFQFMRTSLFVFSVIMGLFIFYVLLHGMRNGRNDASVLLYGEGLMVMFLFHDLFLALGWIESQVLNYLGALISTFFILYIIGKRFTSTFMENKRLVVDLQAKNERIEEQVQILHQLNLAGGKLTGILDRTQVLEAVFHTLKWQADISVSALYMVDQEQLERHHSYPRVDETLLPEAVLWGQGAIGYCARVGHVIYLPDVRRSTYFKPARSLQPASMICLPLLNQKTVIGVLCLVGVAHHFEPHSEARAVAETIARFLTSTLKNIQLVEHTAKTARMEAELQTAAAVQQALFPKDLPQVAALQMATYFQSATETGGDWYGIITDIPGNIYLMIGDVTGHGTPAALVAATASATCRTLETMYIQSGVEPNPSDFLKHLNRAVYIAGAPDFLMTFFVAQVNLTTGVMTFSNAGHNFPIVVRTQGRVTHLINTNSHLGRVPDREFSENTFQLEKGDLVFMFTDGLIENINPAGDMLGERKLIRMIYHSRQLEPKELVDKIVKQAYDFFEEEPLEDDMTILACRVLKSFDSDPAKANAGLKRKESVQE